MDEPVLKTVWDADVPASDPRFALAVMGRIEQRRFRRELVSTVGLAAMAVVLLGFAMPVVEITWRESFAPYASNLVILAVLAAVTLVLPQFLPARD
jgi:uncharacterized membrane protein